MGKVRVYPPEIKAKAIQLRKQGKMYSEIQHVFSEWKIPKNTLSCWMTRAGVVLTEKQLNRILNKRTLNLELAHIKAAEWNRNQKNKRLKLAHITASSFLSHHPRNHINDLFFFSGFYLGEGVKKDDSVMFANANPKIVKAFYALLQTFKSFDFKKVKASVHLRYDQNIQDILDFWSNFLQIPLDKFHKTQLDPRTKGKPTFPDYKGVCSIHYFDARIQRILLELQNQYVENILKMGG